MLEHNRAQYYTIIMEYCTMTMHNIIQYTISYNDNTQCCTITIHNIIQWQYTISYNKQWYTITIHNNIE